MRRGDKRKEEQRGGNDDRPPSTVYSIYLHLEVLNGSVALGLDGRTVFDMPADGRLTMSELAGRSEVRALLSLLNAASERVVSEQQFAA